MISTSQMPSTIYPCLCHYDHSLSFFPHILDIFFACNIYIATDILTLSANIYSKFLSHSQSHSQCQSAMPASWFVKLMISKTFHIKLCSKAFIYYNDKVVLLTQSKTSMPWLGLQTNQIKWLLHTIDCAHFPVACGSFCSLRVLKLINVNRRSTRQFEILKINKLIRTK